MCSKILLVFKQIEFQKALTGCDHHQRSWPQPHLGKIFIVITLLNLEIKNL